MKKFGIRTVGVVGIIAAYSGAALVGCDDLRPLDLTSKHEVGALGFKLSVPSGASINAVSYSVSTTSSSFTKMGDIPLGGSGTTFLMTLNNLPVGTDYTIRLDATEADDVTKCAGSAKFDVVLDSTTAVTALVQCPGSKDTTPRGNVAVDGSINICPVVQTATATPSADGKKLILKGLGTDDDSGPNALAYKWTASAGKMDGDDKANTTLTCPKDVVEIMVSLKVYDGNCDDKIALAPVKCCKNEGGDDDDDTSLDTSDQVSQVAQLPIAGAGAQSQTAFDESGTAGSSAAGSAANSDAAANAWSGFAAAGSHAGPGPRGGPGPSGPGHEGGGAASRFAAGTGGVAGYAGKGGAGGFGGAGVGGSASHAAVGGSAGGVAGSASVAGAGGVAGSAGVGGSAAGVGGAAGFGGQQAGAGGSAGSAGAGTGGVSGAGLAGAGI